MFVQGFAEFVKCTTVPHQLPKDLSKKAPKIMYECYMYLRRLYVQILKFVQGYCEKVFLPVLEKEHHV